MVGFDTIWVKQHRSSPFSVAIVRFFIAQNYKPKKEDTLGERCFDYLLPEAKENNHETEILENLFSIYNDKYTNNLFIKESNSNNYIYLNDKNYSKIPLGSTAPDFDLKDTLGKAISLNNFKDVYLLIDFWGSWCVPCRRNNPSLKELYDQYRKKGLRVISISTEKDAEKWKNAIREDKMNWAQGSDHLGLNSIVALQYGITAFPTYILLDPNRKIILKSSGEIEFIRKKINEIL
jgi:peroxiredoxin